MSRQVAAGFALLATALLLGGCSVPFIGGDDEGPSEAERLVQPPNVLDAGRGDDDAGGAQAPTEDRIRVEAVEELDPASLLDQADGMPVLDLGLPPEIAWRVAGRALERSGFAIEDRDEGERSYTLLYDAAAEQPEEEEGFFASLAFWRDDPVPPVGRYRLQVEPRGDDSRLRLLAGDRDGDAPPAVSRQVLAVLAERLRP